MKIFDCDDKIVQDEIKTFIKLPYEFTKFLEFENLVDNELSLMCVAKTVGDPIKKWVPAYRFSIMLFDKAIGEIDIRIGYTDGLYYGGNIGYGISEAYRGHGYAVRACKLIGQVARAHKMKRVIISNEYSNHASKRVCEKLGAKFLRTVKLPIENVMRQDGHEFENIFIWNLD